MFQRRENDRLKYLVGEKLHLKQTLFLKKEEKKKQIK